MAFNYSYWERQTFVKNVDYLIIGGGLVGINTAISLKVMAPDSEVMVVESHAIPIGASTRNAGFACFGSVTELLDDIEQRSVDETMSLLKDRYTGLQFLRERVGDQSLSYQPVGGYEVFDHDVDVKKLYGDQIQYLNKIINDHINLKKTFEMVKSPVQFKSLNKWAIYNQYEGCLHPGQMMQHLYQMAYKLGVKIMTGTKIVEFKEVSEGLEVRFANHTLYTRKLAICTNGFTNDLEDIPNLQPARNQIYVTQEIPWLVLRSCFHYDRGYVYFRNVDNRILIGGGRNIDKDTETTSSFNTTDKIKNYLSHFLLEKIGISSEIRIDYAWSGIMGVGTSKTPILEKRGENIIFAVRLGGMGIALGARLGDQAAKLMLSNTIP
ncbi:NAD(P)/FAD-dependent oxidoreductase [Portibacter marinus]|uniref:NAD(P)/FAD-dependent oxidoreductase n=1 Tax=Portibacter marinus TaxID=2898660 RepID=UPI001F22A7C8|nr:FAD-dependent oxidoreductase [Portibacter marinus]